MLALVGECSSCLKFPTTIMISTKDYKKEPFKHKLNYGSILHIDNKSIMHTQTHIPLLSAFGSDDVVAVGS